MYFCIVNGVVFEFAMCVLQKNVFCWVDFVDSLVVNGGFGGYYVGVVVWF